MNYFRKGDQKNCTPIFLFQKEQASVTQLPSIAFGVLQKKGDCFAVIPPPSFQGVRTRLQAARLCLVCVLLLDHCRWQTAFGAACGAIE